MRKVSIILPVYNREKYLVQAIDSVLRQTYQNWELLISDNCSQDRSAEIAQGYAAQDSRIVFWQNETNIGLFRNYNKCIEKSSGDYIELFGADDVLEPNCLEVLVKALDTHADVALATAARNLIDKDGQCIGTVRPHTGAKLFSQKEIIGDTIGTLNNWIVAPVMYRSQNKGKGFALDLKLSADLEYWINILEGGKLLYVDEVLFNYRVHPGSETSRIFADFSYVLDVLRLADKFAHYVVDENTESKSFKSLVVERLLTLTNYTVKQLKLNYDSLLLPYEQKDKLESVTATEQDIKGYLQDVYDYKRIACMVLLHATDPGQEQQKLKDERDILKEQLAQNLREKEALNNCITEQANEISTLLNSQSWKITAPLRMLRKRASAR